MAENDSLAVLLHEDGLVRLPVKFSIRPCHASMEVFGVFVAAFYRESSSLLKPISSEEGLEWRDPV